MAETWLARSGQLRSFKSKSRCQVLSGSLEGASRGMGKSWTAVSKTEGASCIRPITTGAQSPLRSGGKWL